MQSHIFALNRVSCLRKDVIKTLYMPGQFLEHTLFLKIRTSNFWAEAEHF